MIEVHDETWAMEGPDALRVTPGGSGLQIALQRYDAFGVRADGSCWSHRQYRLSDGTWWSIGYYHPPDLSYKPELEIGES